MSEIDGQEFPHLPNGAELYAENTKLRGWLRAIAWDSNSDQLTIGTDAAAALDEVYRFFQWPLAESGGPTTPDGKST